MYSAYAATKTLAFSSTMSPTVRIITDQIFCDICGKRPMNGCKLGKRVVH